MSTPNHFDSIAEVFDRIWYFSDDYKDFVIEHILHDLQLERDDILADIGGGTGSFTSRLREKASLASAYCIEPSEPMCAEADKRSDITALCCDAEGFLALEKPFSKILFKEVIHHISDRRGFWHRLYPRLPREGKILIITRPQHVAFPFFTAAREAFARHQPSTESLMAELGEGGFEVELHRRSHTFTLPKEEWYTMLRHRFMSDLGIFSDEEIEAGIGEIESLYPQENLSIADHLLFIIATKK
jgi:ubiquinone/menaquinone biosynthesis C-methylase UbiE